MLAHIHWVLKVDLLWSVLIGTTQLSFRNLLQGIFPLAIYNAPSLHILTNPGCISLLDFCASWSKNGAVSWVLNLNFLTTSKFEHLFLCYLHLSILLSSVLFWVCFLSWFVSALGILGILALCLFYLANLKIQVSFSFSNLCLLLNRSFQF